VFGRTDKMWYKHIQEYSFWVSTCISMLECRISRRIALREVFKEQGSLNYKDQTVRY
jgi:hypothetical protein